MRSRRKTRTLIVPAVAAIALITVACTSGSDSGSTSGSPGGDRQPGPDQLRGQVAHRPGGPIQRHEHRRPREPRLHRDERQRLRQADRRAERRRAAGHHLPIRHVDAAARDSARHHGSHRQGAGPELQLERLLGGCARGRDRRRARVRDPGSDRQPCDRLQQGSVPAGGHLPPDGELDLGRLHRGSQGADGPLEEAVRLRVPDRRE